MPAAVVSTIVPATTQLEGAGFEVHRPFPSARLAMVDPFLLLDQMGPVMNRPGEAIGTPDHPHRGFETVTYLLDGEIEHVDSLGSSGRLGPGDTQWMTAGAGIVHREGPSPESASAGGPMHGVQLWVNLPAAAKMTPPRYQDLRAADVAVAEIDGAMVRVIAGNVFGLDGPGQTHTPISYSHVTMPPNTSVSTDLDSAHTVAVYVLTGSAEVGGRDISARELALMEPGATQLTLSGPPSVENNAAEVLVLTGQPIDEPVARAGPFVMNTRAELHQAMLDFRSGEMGSIPARSGSTSGA
jgi:redox-sensitive bicupin YhaK (pirin superfamily)